MILKTTYRFIASFLFMVFTMVLLSNSLLSQSIPNQGAYIHRGATMAVFNMHSFAQGGLFFTPGVIGTERIPEPGKVLFARGSLWMDVADDFYLDGYVEVSEQRPFTFPIGDNGYYRPIALTNAKDANAAYFNVDPGVAVTSRVFGGDFPVLPVSGPFDSEKLSGSVNQVSNREYWDINSDQFTFITLTWIDSSEIAALTQNDISQLGIVGWNGEEWEYIPSIVDENALTIESAIPSFLDESKIDGSGSITTSIPLIPNQYEVYTFGCIANKSNEIVTIEILEDSGLNEICLDSIFGAESDSLALCSSSLIGRSTIENGCLYFEPEANANGIETICIEVLGENTVDTLNVVVTIIPVNDAPIAVTDSFIMDNSFDLTVDLVQNDLDVDGDDLVFQNIIRSPGNGKITIINNVVVYRPEKNFIGIDSFSYSVCDLTLCDTAWVIVEVNDENGNLNTCVEIETKVFLEGAFDYSSSEMNFYLNERRYLPGQIPFTFFGMSYRPGHPYDIAPWSYLGDEGIELDATLTGDDWADYPETAVDYLLISLRSDNSMLNTVCQKVGLLYKDGTVSILDEDNCCLLDKNRSYYIVIEHRNHLPVMSDIPLSILNDTIAYDFRTQDSFIEALGKGQKEIYPGTFLMYAGNGDQTISSSSRVDINVRDLGAWLIDDGLNSSYYFMDFDLNGDVNVQDKGLFLQNLGVFSDVNF